MSPEYKMYIRLDDIVSLSDLNARAAEYEAIEQQHRERKSKPEAMGSPIIAAAT